jgi:hypothetical protein
MKRLRTLLILLAASLGISTGLMGCGGGSGSNGAIGSDGFSTLALVTDEASGSNCSSGGKKVSVGSDANKNGVLDSSEVY